MALNFANNNSLSSITALPASISGGGLNLISTQTASSSSTLSFTSGIDSTYKEYIFKFINIHPASDANLTFNASTDSGSNYNVTATTTYFNAYHLESGSESGLAYSVNNDHAQDTGFKKLTVSTGSGDDESCSGYLHLFQPSSTTFVKHYLGQISSYQSDNYAQFEHFSGYYNSTSAIDAIQFKMSSGNIDAGTISLYGVV